jgi:hypothetical protein
MLGIGRRCGVRHHTSLINVVRPTRWSPISSYMYMDSANVASMTTVLKYENAPKLALFRALRSNRMAIDQKNSLPDLEINWP